MKDLIIIGASGFGREVAWLVERINRHEPTWNLLGFMDDNESIQHESVNGYEVIGRTDDAGRYPDAHFVCAVGASKIRETIIKKINTLNHNAKFATLIDPSVEMSESVSIGEGSVICAHTILTVNIELGSHVIINLDCTVGHDAIIEDYVTLYPSVNVSGATRLCKCAEIGTGTQIIQGKMIGGNAIVGAGSVVVKDIPANCTAVGAPARPIKYSDWTKR